MPTDIHTLESLDIFSELKSEELEQIAPLMHPTRVTEGEILIRKGDPAKTFFCVAVRKFYAFFQRGPDNNSA